MYDIWNGINPARGFPILVPAQEDFRFIQFGAGRQIAPLVRRAAQGQSPVPDHTRYAWRNGSFPEMSVEPAVDACR